MRIGRFELIRYGHFTDRVLEFPRQPCDLHVIVGPNEAGKSTLLEAIGDFLFGIPKTRAMSFLHDNKALLLGATLESEGEPWTARRRKGLKDTLLREDGVAVAGGEAALRPYLGPVDRALFERMFSLNHVRLREGGQALLDARDEVGQMLFAASAGIASVRSLVDNLRAESDALWGPRRAEHRRFTGLEQRLLDARRSLQADTVTAKDWAERRERLEETRAHHQEIAGQIGEQEIQQGKLARIRRVSSMIARIAELTTERDTLGDVVRLPEDARETLAAAQRARSEATAALRALEASVAERQREHEAIQIDGPLLERAEEIARLEHERGAVEKAQVDEVTLRRALAGLEAEIVGLARELGWEASDAGVVAARAPQKAVVAQGRALVDERAAWAQARTAAERALSEVREKEQATEAKRAALGPAEEVSALAGLTEAAQAEASLDVQIEQVEGRIREEQHRIERRLAGLEPAVSSAQAWAEMRLPTADDVRTHADAQRTAEDALMKVREAMATKRRELGVLRADAERLEREEGVVGPEAVSQAREQRDGAWALIERHYVRREPLEPEVLASHGGADALVGSYPGLVVRADELADHRFERASAAARVIELRRSMHHLEAELAGLLDHERSQASQCAALETQWKALWTGAGVHAGTPSAMLRWLGEREAVLLAWASVEKDQRGLADLRAKRAELRKTLLRGLQDAGVGTGLLEGERIAPLVHAAAAEWGARRERNAARARATEESREAGLRRQRKAAELEALGRQGQEWLARWVPVGQSLGLTAEADVAVLRAQLGTLDELREKVAGATTLRRDRIETIEQERQAWEARVAAVVTAVAADLQGLPRGGAVRQVNSRLAAAQETARRQRSLAEEMTRQQESMRQHREAEGRASEQLAGLQKLAGAHSIEALDAAVTRSDRLRALEAALVELRAELARHGDGLPEEQLAEECGGVDLDEIKRREAGLAADLGALRERLAEARDEMKAAQREFDAVGGDDRAARAQAAVQAVAAELREVGEEYLRASVASRLLDWAIERYRREKQGPLLTRAGELFGLLTGGSFARLAVRYDERDVPQLVGERPDGKAVELEGMSDGTRDQLFLALRIAALEHYFESASLMPFVAGDLFIHFDEERGRAGFVLLGQLARCVQVLFLTHDRHMVELARNACGEGVGVVEL